jgi:hypothetical protein
MKQNRYRENLIGSVNTLVEAREMVFGAILNLSMAGELKEWNDCVEIGEVFTFTKAIFKGCDDENIQLMVKLLDSIENTCDSICNINNLLHPEDEQTEF